MLEWLERWKCVFITNAVNLRLLIISNVAICKIPLEKPLSLYLFLSSRLKATVIAVYFRGSVIILSQALELIPRPLLLQREGVENHCFSQFLKVPLFLREGFRVSSLFFTQPL